MCVCVCVQRESIIVVAVVVLAMPHGAQTSAKKKKEEAKQIIALSIAACSGDFFTAEDQAAIVALSQTLESMMQKDRKIPNCPMQVQCNCP